LKIYPNPTDGTLKVDMTYNLIEIYDVNGKMLKQFDNKQLIDISDLGKYIYFVRIIGDSFVRTEKIILN